MMGMRMMAAIAAGIGLFAGQVWAQPCPDGCPIKGGGPAATDCLLEFGGVTPDQPGGRVSTCIDGADCDADGEVNGSCDFMVTPCLNQPSETCTATRVDSVRVRGRSEYTGDLQAAIDPLLPATTNVCGDPVTLTVPTRAQQAPLGTRHLSFTDSTRSFFTVNGLQLGNFTGYIDLRAGAPDPETGFAFVDVVGASEYIYTFVSFAGIALCIKPVLPESGVVEQAGVIACSSSGGVNVRFSASGQTGSEAATDRDTMSLVCKPSINFSFDLDLDHNIGVVGEDGFTAEDCEAAGGSVEGPDDKHPGVCNGGFEPKQGGVPDHESGAMLIAPQFDPRLPIVGLPVEIIQESALPCGDEGGSSGISAAIPLTTESSTARILSPGAVRDAPPLISEVEGENFSCREFSTENGPGGLVFSAPQADLNPLIGDGVTSFRFFDK